ncbi:MAG: hypothetical protein WCW68_07835 [Methanothrix sp.]
MLEAKLKVIRQAILAYERMIEEEELALVHKAVEIEMKDIEAKKSKTHSFEDIKKIFKR